MTTAQTEKRSLLLDASARIAIIAGSGRLPVEVAESLAARGHPPFVILIAGDAEEVPELIRHDHIVMAVEEIGVAIPALKSRKITHVVMAGGVSRRPKLRAMRPHPGLLPLVATLIRVLRKGDNGVLAAVVRVLEARGFAVVGAHELLPDLLAREGCLTSTRPQPRDHRDLDAAFTAARALGALDIGQAAVAIGGRVVAVEGIEGTDGLLDRVRLLRGHGRIAGVTGGVLVKCAKPGQELRTDLPTIGPLTVDAAHAAGLAGIGIEADHSLVLEHGEVVRRADALGLFVVGLPRGVETP